MKTTRTKILFMVLFFSAVVPFVMQAGLDRTLGSEVLKIAANSSYNFLSKHSYVVSFIVGGGFAYLALELSKKMKKRAGYHKLEREADDKRRELSAKVDTQELIEDPQYGGYYLTSLEQASKEEIHNALKFLDLPDSLIEKMILVGKKSKEKIDYSRSKEWVACAPHVSNEFDSVPYAVIFDTNFLESASPLVKGFYFLHEGGHVAADYEGVSTNDKSNEVIADIFALDAFIKKGKKNQLRNLANSPFVMARPDYYLSAKELIYYGEEIFDIQQEGGKLDPSAYARKISIARKKDGYKEEMTQKMIQKMKTSGELLDSAAFNFGNYELIIQYENGGKKTVNLGPTSVIQFEDAEEAIIDLS